jgi:hypothetical protein
MNATEHPISNALHVPTGVLVAAKDPKLLHEFETAFIF